MIPVPIHSLEKDTIQMTDHEIHSTIDTEIILTIETEAIQIIEIKDIIINQENFQKIDQINKDLFIITIRIYHEKIHKIGIQTTTIDKETTLNLLVEITHVNDITTT